MSCRNSFCVPYSVFSIPYSLADRKDGGQTHRIMILLLTSASRSSVTVMNHTVVSAGVASAVIALPSIVAAVVFQVRLLIASPSVV